MEIHRLRFLNKSVKKAATSSCSMYPDLKVVLVSSVMTKEFSSTACMMQCQDSN